MFDINRYAAVKSRLIIDDPAPLTDRLMKDSKLPFTLNVVTNEHKETTRVISKEKKPFSADAEDYRNLDLSWPPGAISLSYFQIPADWLLRLRYNPFYDFLESHAIQWIDNANRNSVNR